MTDKPTKQKDYTSPALAGAGDYNEAMYSTGCTGMIVDRALIPDLMARGASQMLPDPDWKAEDQKEAQAKTIEGNNDDNDNQGGDMPSWMFREETNRGKSKN